MPRIYFESEAELEAYKAEKREYARQYRTKLKDEGKKPYRSFEALERDKLRSKTAEAKAKRSIRDKLRQSTPEFKAKKNAARRAALRAKSAAEGRSVYVRRIKTEAEKNKVVIPRIKFANDAERMEHDAVKSRNRRALKKKAGGKHTLADIKALFFEQKGMCGLCDLPLDANSFHVDHWKPLSKGGSNDKSNLKLLHPKCNLSKGAKLPEEFKVA